MLEGTGVSIHCVWNMNDPKRLMINVIDFRATSHDNKYSLCMCIQMIFCGDWMIVLGILWMPLHISKSA